MIIIMTFFLQKSAGTSRKNCQMIYHLTFKSITNL